MISMLKFMLMMMYTSLLKNINPVKMSMMLLFTSATLFLMMNLHSGKSWYPSIFFLLFMGGILIMFMILSSIMPNEMSKKLKIYLSFIMIASFYFITSTTNCMNKSIDSIKWFMGSNMILILMIFIMLTYFFVFLSIMSKEKLSMRSMY